MRPLRKEEKDLIAFLLSDKPGKEHLIEQLPYSTVEEMNDGGMGSLKFLYNDNKKRRMGCEIATISLKDIDDTFLSIALNLDEDENLFELDVWKVDFSPLKQFPLPPYKGL